MASRPPESSTPDSARKPYTPPVITDLGDVVEKTLGGENDGNPEEFGSFWGWINVIGAIDESRKAPRRR